MARQSEELCEFDDLVGWVTEQDLGCVSARIPAAIFAAAVPSSASARRSARRFIYTYAGESTRTPAPLAGRAQPQRVSLRWHLRVTRRSRRTDHWTARQPSYGLVRDLRTRPSCGHDRRAFGPPHRPAHSPVTPRMISSTPHIVSPPEHRPVRAHGQPMWPGDRR